MALIVTCLCADQIASSGEPKPRYIAVPYGIIIATVWGIPLWASTFEIHSKWRFVVALLLLATGVITSFVMHAYNLIIFGFVATATHCSARRPINTENKAMTDPWTLKDEVLDEAYAYFDREIRPLVKLPAVKVDPATKGLEDNDADAFQHAYVSGVFTQVFGKNSIT